MLKKILVTTALVGLTSIGFSGTANAAANGFYVNGQLGYGHSDVPNSLFSPARADIKNDGLAGRIAAGYQFTPYIAAELGYTKFSDVKVDNITVEGVNIGNARLEQQAIDLVAKGILPINNGFNAFGTLGVASLYAKGHGMDSTEGTFGNGSTSRIMPTFGLGLGYDITPNLPITASWQRIQRIGDSSGLRTTDFFAVGLEYHFG